MVHQSWLLRFSSLSVPFFKRALTSEPGSVAHLRCWRVTTPLLLLLLMQLSGSGQGTGHSPAQMEKFHHLGFKKNKLWLDLKPCGED